ncbi:Rid family hydrolase [Paludisphaera soli]|uniref:Rid family hydrolase n=1 Tax=Paludisphaera soli TaxID=2712865 RepID=UPI0013E9F679|nr:Rid family hydrolase [Paludisphaera soli]
MHQIAAFLLTLSLVAPLALGDDALRRLRVDSDRAGTTAVVVSSNVPLVHTAQVFPVDEQGRPAADEAQVGLVLDRLDAVLKAAGSDASRVVRLHVVLARDDLRDAVRAAFAGRLDGREGPAWTFVGGEPAVPGALLAVDAVATTDAPTAGAAVARAVVPGFSKSQATFAVLPGWPRVFISGQAEPDEDLAAATRKTLRSLGDSLKLLGLDRDDVVQLKAFVQPSDAAAAEVVARESSAFFEGGTPPPLVVVGWKSSTSQPIEIELIAASPAPGGPDRLDFPPLPPLKPSPVFSRSARVNRGSLVYVSGLMGPENATGAEQVRSVFDDLRAVLDEAGSDFRQMAKATYYVSDPAADAALGAIRPLLYDPDRPPAASKAAVAGVAAPGRGIAVDMIAVAP